jgi:hypothetical protein
MKYPTSIPVFLITISLLAADPIRILPVGDSITAGEHYGHPAKEQRTGYRKPLYELLIGAGVEVDFVGSQEHGIRAEEDPDWYDWNNEGYPGWKIPEIAEKLEHALPVYLPDILLVHVGTNGKDWDQKPDQVMDLLDKVETFAVTHHHPVKVFLCQIIKRFIEEDSTETSRFNEVVSERVESRTDKGIQNILVAMETGAGLDYSDALPDPHANPPTEGGDMLGRRYAGVPCDKYHPNDKGNLKMAQMFFNALMCELKEENN